MVNEVMKSAGEQRQQADRELLDAAETVEDLEKQLDDSEERTTSLRTELEQAHSAVQAHAVEVATLRERLTASEQLTKRSGEETAQVLGAQEIDCGRCQGT